MKRIYPDTAIIVSAYTEEISTALADDWMRSIGGDQLMTSPWIDTEIAAALAGKARAGVIAPRERDALLTIIRESLSRSATLVAVHHGHFVAAADLLARSPKPLRAGDALHLAIANEAGATLWTFDRAMTEAGQALGLDAHRLA